MVTCLTSDYPFRIELRGRHNHTINTAAALRYRDVDESVHSKFVDLFEAGYSPSAAYHLHQFDLQNQHDQQYYIISGDLRYCPDKDWCYRYAASLSQLVR